MIAGCFHRKSIIPKHANLHRRFRIAACKMQVRASRILHFAVHIYAMIAVMPKGGGVDAGWNTPCVTAGEPPTPRHDMYPLDPVEPAAVQSESPMAPPYVDENPNVDLVEQGMRVAENEKRDAVTGAYENEAAASDEPEEALDAIMYPEGSAKAGDPELSAVKVDSTPPDI